MPRQSVPKKRSLPEETPAVRPAAPPAESTAVTTPLDYMLAVMRDAAIEPERRDEMAKLALPYMHPKAATPEGGVKDGTPGETSPEMSQTEVARRIGFLLASAALRT